MSRIDEIVFMALCLWREARGESEEAKIGVGMCILNRAARPSWWGTNIMEVIFKKWQFSSLTDPNDKQLTLWPKENNPAWESCLILSEKILKGDYEHPAPGADSYHDVSIPAPYWAKPEQFVGQIGRLRFFNTDNDHEMTKA